MPKLTEAMADSRAAGKAADLLFSLLDNATLPLFLPGLFNADTRIASRITDVLRQGRAYDPNKLLDLFQDPDVPKARVVDVLAPDKGYEIIERNYRFSHGEIDIIAIDPKDKCTVFVEVKARQNLEFGEPEYSITKNKQKQIKKMAQLYLYEREITEIDCRFDVFAILFVDLNNPQVNQL